MVTDPTVYSVIVTAIAFLGFSLGAIVRSFNPPQIEPQQTIALVLPEPPRPIGLLSASDVLPIAPPIAPPIKKTEIAQIEQYERVADTNQSMIAIAGLLAATENRPVTEAIAPVPAAPVPAAPVSPLIFLPEPRLYRPTTLYGTTKMIRPASTIPNPWEPDSDRYWNQNNTTTYPNIVPALAGSCV